ncbi:MAG TPA: carboxypeptidase regulatory-like domain-containing protein [Bryobacteraceae bacterium]|nr:carboxypeptidase regulatory-like domain-containing protein [Bryobacteraceae bacterium]
MALKRLSWLAFWAGICLAPAIAQPPGNGAISGTVMEGQSDEGVRKAIVTLTIEGEPRRWATARTDGSGHFQFDGLPAGTYKLRAAKNNEGTATYGAKGVHELGESITLAEGEIRGGLVLRFLRGASIEGRVFDPDGDPVGQAEIALLRRGRDQGAPILANYRGASSDERGEYRFTNIDPGRYYIRVSPGGPKFGGIPNPQRILVEQYYGGARDAKEASPVHVGDGEHLTDVDVRLAAEAAVQIHGQVLGVPEEADPAKPQVALLRVNGAFHAGPGVGVQVTPADGGQIHWSQGAIAQGPEHRFEIENLPAGRYLVEASFSSGGKTYSASQIIDARSGSGDVTLTLAPAIEIHGTLRMEGTHKGSGSVEVELQRRGPAGNRVSAEVGADGHFTLAPVPPGEWNLDVRLPEGFLKSARLGDKEVRFSTFEIGANNDAALNIVASTRTASIQGEVDSTGARAGILVARADEFHGMTRYYYTAEADAQGKFHVDGIAPGRYKVFAFENMAARAFRDPEDIASLEELGETVDLAEGATVEAHPKLIPMERAAKALQ